MRGTTLTSSIATAQALKSTQMAHGTHNCYSTHIDDIESNKFKDKNAQTLEH